MQQDEVVLSYIARNDQVSQRQLAAQTNLSLGHLNLILHRLVSKGLLKIEKVNARNLRYIVTPQGIARNTKRTYNFIRSAFQQITQLQAAFQLLVTSYADAGYTVFLPQENDEVGQILNMTRQGMKLDQVNLFHDYTDISFTKTIVVVWTEQQEASCAQHELAFVNLLSQVEAVQEG